MNMLANHKIGAALCAIVGVVADAGSTLAAPDCSAPGGGNWTITEDCNLAGQDIAPRNISIRDSATLRIMTSGSLNIDLTQFRIVVENDARLLIDDGGRLYSFPIGPLLKDNTDGMFGYYLKLVNGPVVEAFNRDVQFYAASTIKVLQNLHAHRQVDLGAVSLAGSSLTVCSAGTNCTNAANTAANCGSATVSQSLSQAIQLMMGPSNNQSTNAIQELFGNGTPSLGRAAMNQTGQTVVGMSGATSLEHKLNCGNVTNNPFNTLTLADLALLYEQVATDPTVLFPASQPASIQLPATSFYQLMLNHNGNRFVDPVITTEADSIGMTASDREAFRNLVRMAQKAGNIGTSRMSIGGWISLPVDGGADTRDYVYGYFVDNATINTLPGAPGSSAIANVLLRSAIRDALEDW